MRFAACTIVAVLGISLDALAQPPAHANGKAHAYAFGHARRAEFAVNDFKVGLQALGAASAHGSTATSASARSEAPAARVDAPVPPRHSASAKTAPPNCIAH